ncbi:hypothetical protein ACEWY4_011221 [Coilia grayii]|uniref:Voltage-dependent calcium channel alpha-2/delta subunit conserved region domain-containing protein n=1 Tax=Coilia grayii TaxID=363190 RepID=A0ABD1K469_9TELE
MSVPLLQSRLLSLATQPNDTDCSNVEGVCPLSCDSIDLGCYILDHNGFILISKEKNDIGKFFGEVDGSVMAQLLKSGLYKRVSLYDYQAMCKSSHGHSSDARPLLSPFYGLAAVVKWFLSHFMLFLLEFNICGLWHSDYVADAKSVYHSGHKQKKVDIMQPCNTEYPGFMYDTTITETNSIIKCGRCQKMFVLQQVRNTNLVMVVLQADCDCSRQYSPITLTPKEVKYILFNCTSKCVKALNFTLQEVATGGIREKPTVIMSLTPSAHNATVKCNRMKSQKIRRRPESCHAYHPHENAKDCGGACEISVSVALLFVSLVTSLALR